MTSPLLWTLIVVQMAMGAFDTFYHHELTERLAWRPSQRRELLLHGARNLLYAVLFLALGWTQMYGALAVLVIAILATELVITLMDFVEEDLSRKLPASERITHTLLALNYGAILVLLLPILLSWAHADTGIQVAYHGWLSLLTAVAAFGVVVGGARDLAAASRTRRLIGKPAAALMTALPLHQTVLVTGATGFIGRRLVEGLAAADHQTIVLTRHPEKASALRPPFRIVTDLDQIPSGTHIDAIVNLAGEPIAGGLWTPKRRRAIVESRREMAAGIVRLIARLDTRPTVLVSASAVGWYGLRDDEKLTEESDSRACFSHDICEMCETEAAKAGRHGVRVACLRIGLVLGTEGGMLSRLLTPFEYGMGGPIGSGRQWMSWIARDDLVRLIAHVIATPSLEGPVNATAPVPVRNAELATELGHALHRPAILRMPAAPLRLLAGDFAKELLLGGQRVLPTKALASGFTFRHETIRSALTSLVGAKPARKPAHRLAATERLKLS